MKDKAISFYFLPIKDMGLTDELYIKMNSRGKPLTGFEHFKAELERELKQIDESMGKRIMHKIDIEWTDMLWGYRGDNNITDDEFLRYFRFVCDIICYKAGGTSQGKSQNEFDLLASYFTKDCENATDNIALLESYFDVWYEVSKECTPTEFLAKYISTEHEDGKIKFENKPDIFDDCLQSYADVYGNGNRSFPLNRIILLYAIVAYLQNKKSISEEEFIRRIRVVHNLVRNSEDEISDSESRSAGNRMPAILRQVDSIIVSGVINDAEENNFNTFQLEEEKEKLIWVKENTDKADDLYKLEDNRVLRGQVAVIGLENYHNFEKFIQLFTVCRWDLIDCALAATGDYRQCERNGWRFQLGSRGAEKSWINLFHKSANKGFNETKETLKTLLESIEEINDDSLSAYIQTYIDKCEEDSEYGWRYYYVKYNEFRPGRYGKYSWHDMENGSYDMHALWTESQWSENSYQPFLYAAKPEIISRDDLGHYSIWKDMWIEAAEALEDIGTNYYHRDNFTKAKDIFEKVLELRKSCLQKAKDCGGDIKKCQELVAYSYNSMGVAFTTQKDYEVAIGYFEKSLEIEKNLLGEEHLQTARSLHNLGAMYLYSDRLDEAESYLLKALDIRQRLAGDNHPETQITLNMLGHYYDKRREYSKAKEYFCKALDISRAINGVEHRSAENVLANLGVLCKKIGEYVEAREYLEENLRIRERVYGPESDTVARSLHVLGMVYELLEIYDKALECYERELKIGKLLKSESPDLEADGLNDIGVLYRKTSDYQKSIDYLYEALNMRRVIYGDQSIQVSFTCRSIGLVMEKLENYDEAIKYLEESFAIKKNLRGIDDNMTQMVVDDLIRILEHIENFEQAEIYKKEKI